ncbi:hypothetical protein [Mammaliicoccus sciuri]|uniref:hypothetical protein n=1 Tax=Mammaliicoccus sciuri TaxID=1296 RepID=UPI0034DD872A
MIDMINIIKSHLLKNETIAYYCTNRIRAYDLPESSDIGVPNILISPLMPPVPIEYGSNKTMAMEYHYQIDVSSESEPIAKQISEEIRITMEKLGFGQTPGGSDQYDKTVKRFLDARRYEGVVYVTDDLKHLEKIL